MPFFDDLPQSDLLWPLALGRYFAAVSDDYWALLIDRCVFCVALLPKPLGNLQCIDFQVVPPGHLIAGLMQLAMMTAAERYGELVADFETQRSGLRKPQVMRIGRLPAADQAGLRGDEPQMGFVAQPFGLGDGEKAFVDL